MPLFKVKVERVVRQKATIEVEAPNEGLARLYAITNVWEEYWRWDRGQDVEEPHTTTCDQIEREAAKEPLRWPK